MTGPDSDNELEAFLARRSLTHRRFAEGDHPEPPAELDRLVLAKAREAIKRTSEMPVYRAPQWAMAVGLAASLLLVFAVVLNFVRVSNQQPQLDATRTAAPQVATASDVRELPAETQVVPSAAPALPDAKAEASYAPPPGVASNEAMMKRSKVADTQRQSKPASPAVAQNESEETQDRRSAGAATAGPAALAGEARKQAEIDSSTAVAKRDDAGAHQGFLAGTNRVSGVVSRRSDGESTAGRAAAAASVDPVPEPAQPPATASATSDTALLASTVEAKPPPSDEPTRSEPSKDESKQPYTASTNAGGASTLEEATVIGGRRVRGGKRPAVPNAPAAIAMEKAKHPNPDEWLREIGELRTAGRVEEANRELEMFRRAYPDHSIPSSSAEPPPPAQ